MRTGPLMIKLPIFPKPYIFKAIQFKHIKNANEYWILDTGALLRILPNLDSVIYRIDKGFYKLCIPEIVIRQTVLHLSKSYQDKKERNISTSGIITGMLNFLRFLKNDVKIVAHPNEIPNHLKAEYERYMEDKILVYLLKEGGFKGIVTQDYKLIKKIKGQFAVLSPDKLLSAMTQIDP